MSLSGTSPSKKPLGYPKGATAKQQRAKRRRDDKQRMIEWHNTVLKGGRVLINCQTMYLCFHCLRIFPRNMVCGDHWPHSRGARPDLKYDPANGVCSCMECNRSDHPNRSSS